MFATGGVEHRDLSAPVELFAGCVLGQPRSDLARLHVITARGPPRKWSVSRSTCHCSHIEFTAYAIVAWRHTFTNLAQASTPW